MHNKLLFGYWKDLNYKIKTWWDQDVRSAREKDIRDPEKNAIWYSDEQHKEKEIRTDREWTLLFLPHPYVTSGGNANAFPEMYCWDTYFINHGLLLHKRFDLIRNHIVNQLYMIERFGMVLNANRTYYTTRSQTPLLAADIWRYYRHTGDIDLLYPAYPLLKKEFLGYWNADHHLTQTGLATNRDLGDPELRPELAAEAEVHDFTPCFEGDVRNCNPVQTNCALVRYADILSLIARELKQPEEESRWKEQAQSRRDLINALCWNNDLQFYFEYDHVRSRQLPCWSLSAYWALWSHIASDAQAKSLVEQLSKFETQYGLIQTDRRYPSPHPEFEWVQFQYPAGWPPMHIIVVEGLYQYGFADHAKRIAEKYLRLIIGQYLETGSLWEKYNMVDGNLSFPKERYTVPPFHGWTSAAVLVFGAIIFGDSINTLGNFEHDQHS
jgi:alpha,alpha-trehalase